MEHSRDVDGESDEINALYTKIRSNPKFLDTTDDIPFAVTPLHEAVSEGKTHLAIEILTLKPSLGRKLNPDGLSPLHLALQTLKEYRISPSKEVIRKTVKQLIKFDSELIRVKGRERLTPLHFVAEKKQETQLLAEFLCACPESIWDLTVREETAMHIAVKKKNQNAFKVILEWVWRTYKREVLSWTDENGDTLLHIAVETKQPKIVEWLVRKAPILVNEVNLEGMTAYGIASRTSLEGDDCRTKKIKELLERVKASKDPDKGSTLATFLSSGEKKVDLLFRFINHHRRDLSMEMRNIILVVAVLIATATFQATLSPLTTNIPLNKVVLGLITYKSLFLLFYICNTVAFTASITVIIMVLQWRLATFPLHVSLLFLAGGYGVSMFFLSSPRIAIPLLTVSLVLPWLSYFFKIIFWFVDLTQTFRTWMGELVFWTCVPVPHPRWRHRRMLLRLIK